MAKRGWRFFKKQTNVASPVLPSAASPDAILAAENPCGTPGMVRDGVEGDGFDWLKILIARASARFHSVAASSLSPHDVGGQDG